MGKKCSEREMELLGKHYYRSDLAAEMVAMHPNTLLLKVRQGKTKCIRHGHAMWFLKEWLELLVEG